MNEDKKNIKEKIQRIRLKYVDRFPIQVIFRNNKKSLTFLSRDTKFGEFYEGIIKHANLKSNEALFIFVNNTIPNRHTMISTLFNEHKNEDGYMEMIAMPENSFGYKKSKAATAADFEDV